MKGFRQIYMYYIINVISFSKSFGSTTFSDLKQIKNLKLKNLQPNKKMKHTYQDPDRYH